MKDRAMNASPSANRSLLIALVLGMYSMHIGAVVLTMRHGLISYG